MNIARRNEQLSIGRFNELVKLVARAFYDVTSSLRRLPKKRTTDNRGIAVVVLDALTRREWVREEDLAKDLKIHTKELRKTLHFFVKKNLIERHTRREIAKGVKLPAAALAATTDGQPPKLGKEKIKLYTYSYYCLDYGQIYNIVRYRIHRMKKKLKDELVEKRDTIQKYICPNCSKRYNALDALTLVSWEDEYFHCESCNGELVVESDKLVNEDLGVGDDNAERCRLDKFRVMLQNMEVQLKPLMEHIATLKDWPVPDFGSLQTWEANANAAARAKLAFLHTEVEVPLSDGQAKDSAKETMKTPIPWMMKQGMSLKSEQPVDETSTELLDDKNSAAETDESERLRKEAYYKAYYAGLCEMQQKQEEAYRMQQELSSAASSLNDPSSTRQVGMKFKRDDEWEDDDNVDWEQG